MNWIEVVQAAILILKWLRENPPQDENVTPEQRREANEKMKAAIKAWEEA